MPLMKWLQLVDSPKTYVSFAKEPYKRDCILQKRPMFLGRLLIIATPHASPPPCTKQESSIQQKEPCITGLSCMNIGLFCMKGPERNIGRVVSRIYWANKQGKTRWQLRSDVMPFTDGFLAHGHTGVCACMFACSHEWKCVYIYICVYVYVFVCVRVCVRESVYTYICVYEYIHIYTYYHRHTLTNTHTHICTNEALLGNSSSFFLSLSLSHTHTYMYTWCLAC